jgi:hypothetical protein
MNKAPKINPGPLKNGVGNWVLFFVVLELWKMEAWGVAGGGQESEHMGSGRILGALFINARHKYRSNSQIDKFKDDI